MSEVTGEEMGVAQGHSLHVQALFGVQACLQEPHLLQPSVLHPLALGKMEVGDVLAHGAAELSPV